MRIAPGHGRIVTVTYNPQDPNECILERDAPARIREAWLATAILVALILGCFFAITEGADWLQTVVAHPMRITAVAMLIVISLLVILIGRALTKQTTIMKKWPTTAGRIIRSEVTTTLRQHRRPNRRRGDYNMTMYVRRIVYAYEVGGHALEGDDIGWSTSANRRSVASMCSAILCPGDQPKNSGKISRRRSGRLADPMTKGSGAIEMST
jgi:hypothetical protein